MASIPAVLNLFADSLVETEIRYIRTGARVEYSAQEDAVTVGGTPTDMKPDYLLNDVEVQGVDIDWKNEKVTLLIDIEGEFTYREKEVTKEEFWTAYGKSLLEKGSPSCMYCPLIDRCHREAELETKYKTCEEWLAATLV